MATSQLDRLIRLAALGAAGLAFAGFGCTSYPSAPADPVYDTDVRPIFLAHCTRCHGNGPDGGRLNIVPGAAQPGSTLVACFTQWGSNKSLSIDGGGCFYGAYSDRTSFSQVIHSSDPKVQMPPPPAPRLNSYELDVFDNWIANKWKCTDSPQPNPAYLCPDAGT
jgi:hypothetical protein